MFEFTVPDGDYDYNSETDTYVWKNLVFTEKNWKNAKQAIQEYIRDDIPFTMNFVPKENSNG